MRRVRVKYVTVEQAIFYQQKIIKETGGSLGLRDLGLLDSAISRPRASFSGKDLYPKVLDKAAALFHSMILNHPFLDGNKRTALAVLHEFLKQNGYKLAATQQELIELPLLIERKEMNLNQITKWLKEHTKRLK